MPSNKVIVIIPARGGSKGIPRKNIRSFGGYPLLAYSIAAGLAAKTVQRVIVSTDDEEIAKVALSFGADVPFLRPAEFAQDRTLDLPVFQHALDWLADNESYQPDIVVQLRPTSPYRRVAYVDQAVYRLIETPQADSIRAVCVPFQNPFKMWQVGPDGFMHPLLETQFKEPYNMPRQELPEVFWQTGYVDAAWADTIRSKKSMTGDFILPLIINPSEWIDIDSLDDWQRAERMLATGEISFEELGFEIQKVR